MRKRCPYKFCSAMIETLSTPPYPGSGAMHRDYIPHHPIGSTILSGPCPASLMYEPFDQDTLVHLADARKMHSVQIHQWLMQEATPEEDDPEGNRPESTTLRGPHRIGREPPPEAEEWALGGRADDDVTKDRDAIKPPPIPPTASGYEVGRHVASIDETIGILHAAALNGGEAIASLNAMEDQISSIINSIEEARNKLLGLMGNADVPIIREYLSMIGEAYYKVTELHIPLVQAKNALEVGQNKGEEYIGRLLG